MLEGPGEDHRALWLFTTRQALNRLPATTATWNRIVDDDPPTSTRGNARIRKSDWAIGRTTICARIAMIDAARSTANNHDANHGSDRLTNSAKAATSGATAHTSTANVATCWGAADGTRSRR